LATKRDETFELFQSAAARAYVHREKRLEKLHHGEAMYC
jgi:hypothetical protein